MCDMIGFWLRRLGGTVERPRRSSGLGEEGNDVYGRVLAADSGIKLEKIDEGKVNF